MDWVRVTVIAALIVVVLLIVAALIGLAGMAGMMGGVGAGGMMGGYGGRAALALALGALALLALVGAIVLGIIWLARASGPVRGRGAPVETPDDVLRRRFAAGEITREEYDRIRRALEE